MTAAAACLSEEARLRLPRVPWHQIRGFRNQVIHAYFSVDWAIVREVATVNIPELRRDVMPVLRTEFPDIAARLES